MAHIYVPDDVPGIRSLFHVRPEAAAPMGMLADVLLSGSAALSAGERELIAAYVSALNNCTFCHLSHAAIAACHLGNETLVATVVRDPESAPISPMLKALLGIARQVQQSGRAVGEEHIARARATGATDLEIHDAVLISAAFCMFNRYVDGLAAWTPTEPSTYRERAELVAQHGYGASLPASGARAPSTPA
jgi:uncharacterized peroxidase-related enzyme